MRIQLSLRNMWNVMVTAFLFFVMDMNQISQHFEADEFSGVWTAASLLHLSEGDIRSVVQSIYSLLQLNGVVFLGLKSGLSGTFTVTDKDDVVRDFTFVIEEEFIKLLEEVGFRIVMHNTLDDNKIVNRVHTNWLRILAVKK